MAIAISDFWRLLMESRLLTQEQCQRLSDEFGQSQPDAASPNARALAEWLTRRKVLTAFQSKLLLAGRPGPFFYGEYVVYDRVDDVRFPATFRALHAGTKHPVRLRFLTGTLLETAGDWQAFASAARRECDLVHPHLERCFELVELDDYKFLVLEDLRGKTLAERLKEKPVRVSKACRIVRQAALALHDLRKIGRIHGDVRPATLFLPNGGHVKLLRDVTSPPAPFPWGAPDPRRELLDRAKYLAPEMTQAGRPPDALTDIYALGCTLYYAIAGRPPFVGGDLARTMHLHATERIEPLETFGAPPELGRVVAYMMAKNPQVRFQDAATVAEQLTRFVDDSAQLHVAASAVPPMLAAYEAHLKRKAASPQPAPASPGIAPIAAAPVSAGGAVFPQGFPAAGARPPVGAVPISGAAPLRSERRRRRKSPQKRAALLGAGAVLLILIFVAVAFYNRTIAPTANRSTTSNRQDDWISPDVQADAGNAGVKTNTTAGAAPVQEIVSDDGTSLWASPTSGEPLDLSYSPPGAQVFFAARPADLLATPHGSDALQALGPRFASMTAAWENAAGVKLAEVERLVLALHDNAGQAPRVSVVVHLKEPLDQAALLSRWGNPPPQSQGEAATYSARGWSFYIPPDRQGVFLMGEPSQVEDVAKNPQARPLLRREMERLLRASDSQRHVTALFAPSFLFFDAEKLFSGDLEKLRAPLQEFLGDGLNAALVSVHCDDRFYLEIRLHGTLDREKGKLASEMRDRLARIPDEIEDYVARLVPHPYWRKLALRFPPMVRFLHRQTRVGAEEDHAVINAALPGVAAPNLLAAAELALASQLGAAYAAEVAPAKAAPADIHKLLNLKINLSFPQQSLDFAMRDVAGEVRDAAPDLPFPFDIKLMGKDLEGNGITQNQQIRDFEARDKPLREVLTALVLKANPITTVKAPNEPDQKLIWVIGPDPADPAKNVILITTRDAAAQKRYTLPEEFE